MEAALKLSSHAECMLYSGHLQNEEAATLEKGSVVVEESFLDELFDFEWLPEEAEEEDTLLELKEEQRLDSSPELAKRGHSHSNSGSSSSALSFEAPPPPSELSLPADDVAELEWVSHFVEESFSDYHPPCSVPLLNPPPKPQLATAVVLTVAPIPVKARRSKRARVPGWVHPALSEPSSCSSSCSMTCSSSSSNLLIWGSGMPPLLPAEQQKHKKKRGRKPKSRSAADASEPGGSGERQCSHCGAQKTPQWRTGPEGAKTLCNACGVRYKSGRLLPEYRPACSPTFSALSHSNSHRKVLEMRRKKAEAANAAADDDNDEEPQRVLSSSLPPGPLF